MKFKDFEHYREVYESLPVQGHITDDGVAHIDPNHRVVGDFITKNDINSVLDVGCGDGMFCFYVKSLKNIEVCGIDIQYKAIYQCNHHNVRYETDVKFLYTDVEHFQPKRKYDLVVSFEVIEHVFDVRAFRSFLDKLSSKYIALSTPDRLGVGGISGSSEYHINNFSQQELKDFIGEDRIISFDKVLGEDLVVIYKQEDVST